MSLTFNPLSGQFDEITDVTSTAVGGTPNVNGISIAQTGTSAVITLQPADATNPGIVIAGTQVFGGIKNFINDIYVGTYPFTSGQPYVRLSTSSAPGPTSGVQFYDGNGGNDPYWLYGDGGIGLAIYDLAKGSHLANFYQTQTQFINTITTAPYFTAQASGIVIPGSYTSGTNGSASGSIIIANGSGGGASVTVNNPSATSAYTFSLPSTIGTTNYALTSSGTSGVANNWTSVVLTSQVGAANGVAPLDGASKIPVAYLPNAVFIYQGTWNPNTNTPTLVDGTGTNGYVYYVSAAKSGTVSGLTNPSMTNFQIGDLVIYNGSQYELTTPAAGVQSVNGQQGVVTVNAINQLTGDGTAGPASGSQSQAFTLATVNSNVGSFGNATAVPTFTVNGKGLITAASNTSIQIAESQVTNLVSDLAGKQPTGNYITALTGDATASGPGSAALTFATVNSNTGNWGTASSVSTFTVNGKGLITAASNTSIQIAQSQVTGLTTTYLPLAGGTMSGIINHGGFEATNAADPTVATSLTTRQYVDSERGFVQTIGNGSTTVVLTVTSGKYQALSNSSTGAATFQLPVATTLPAATGYTYTFINRSATYTASIVNSDSSTTNIEKTSVLPGERVSLVFAASTTPGTWRVSSYSAAITSTGTGAVVLASAPTLTNPIVGTQTALDNSTKAASTAYVDSAVATAGSGYLQKITGDINPTSFTAANNQSSAANVTGLAFANGVTRAFTAKVSVTILATSNLYEYFTLDGIQENSGWEMSSSSTGNSSGIVFTITNAGQIQYTSLNYSGFTSATIKFRSETLPV